MRNPGKVVVSHADPLCVERISGRGLARAATPGLTGGALTGALIDGPRRREADATTGPRSPSVRTERCDVPAVIETADEAELAIREPTPATI